MDVVVARACGIGGIGGAINPRRGPKGIGFFGIDDLAIAGGVAAAGGSVTDELYKLTHGGYAPGEGAAIVNGFNAAVQAKLEEAAAAERAQAQQAQAPAAKKPMLKTQVSSKAIPLAPTSAPEPVATRASVPREEEEAKPVPWGTIAVAGGALTAAGVAVYFLTRKKRR